MKTKKIEILIPFGTKKFPLIITDDWKLIDNTKIVHILCEAANIDQNYPKEDITLLLEDIKELIEIEQTKKKTSNLNIRIKPAQKIQIEKNARKKWYKSVSKYMLDLALSN